MGALPDRLVGFQHVENDELRDKCDALWGVRVPPKKGWHLSLMFDAMERGDLTALYVIGENPMQSEADRHQTEKLLRGLETLIVQDIFLTATGEIADVVFPAAAAWAETLGTVTNSRAAGPARATGARAAGRGTRRPADHLRSREADGRRLGRGRRGDRVERGPRSCRPCIAG